MSGLYSMSYISKNSMDDSPHAVEQQIRDILAIAKKNNTKLRITGALLYSGGYFCQVIEGPKDNLEALIKKINTDPRHSDLLLLSKESISERMFPNWEMAFAGIDEEMRFNIVGIKNSKDDIDLGKRANNLVSVLHNLLIHNEILTGMKGNLSTLK